MFLENHFPKFLVIVLHLVAEQHVMKGELRLRACSQYHPAQLSPALEVNDDLRYEYFFLCS